MPFTVKSGQLVVKDVGTEFNISAYDSTDISVAVKEGAVSVAKVTLGKPESLKYLVQLNKNKVGFFNDSGMLSVSAVHNMGLFTGWTQNKFVFRDTPFPKVVKQLERRYNVKGKIMGAALEKRTLTASYNHLSLDQILNVLSASLHISCRQDGNTITFKLKK